MVSWLMLEWHFVGGLQIQRLQGTAFDDRLYHLLAMAQRQLDIGIGQGTVRFGDEGFTRQAGQHVSTRTSSTSQGRICCSTIISRTWE